jgi:hypothetical protein
VLEILSKVAVPVPNLNFLCYDSFTGQGQLLWVGICLQDNFGWRFSLVSMVSINLGIWFYGVEMSDVIAVTRCLSSYGCCLGSSQADTVSNRLREV